MGASVIAQFDNVRPEPDLRSFDTGLLSPEGEFYACSFEEHDYLARSITGTWTTAWDLVKQGWVKFTYGQFVRMKDFHFSKSAACPDVTQKQLDAIFDWTQAWQGRELPRWYTEIR